MSAPIQLATTEITIPRAAAITDMVLQYNGVNDYLLIPELLLGQTIDQMSIEAWVYLEKDTGIQTIWRNNVANNTAFFLAFNNQKLEFGYNSAQVVTFPTIFGINLWYYVVLTYNVPTQQAILYVNAVAEPSAALTTPQKVSIGPATVGGTSNAGGALQGSIGTVRVWKGILAAKHVQLYMYMTLTGNVQARDSATGQVVATLLGNWRCDEGYGKLAFDYTGIFNAALGGTSAASRPDWIVSTILKPPDFVLASILSTPTIDDLEVSIVVQDYGELLRDAATEPLTSDEIRPKSKKAATPARKGGGPARKLVAVKASKAPKRKAKRS